MKIWEVNTSALKADFIRVNVELYQGDANYIRPLDKDINDVFDPQKNKAFRFGEATRWVLKDKEGKLIGRTKEDPRVSFAGMNYAITSMIVTDIRNANTNDNYYTESYGERSGLSTIFEIMAVEPYVNPWNEIEYYKILFNRSDKQVIISD